MNYLDNFNYKISGNLSSDQKLVFLHGLMGAGQNWNKISKPFESDFEILSFDQRGHGRSFQPKTGYQPKDFAVDLKQIIDELGWSKINLVGHSMGGRNAMAFAGEYPDQLEKLVVEDINPGIRLDSIGRMKDLINSVPVPFSSRKEAGEFFKGAFLERFSDPKVGRAIAGFFYMNIVEKKRSGQSDWRFFKPGIIEAVEAGRTSDFWAVLEGLTSPCLFIYGAQSDEIGPVEEERLSANPNIMTREVNGAGHWVHFDQPEQFIKELREFLL